MKKAIIDQNNLVVNIIVLAEGAEWTPPEGHTYLDATGATIGATWNGTEFLPPPEPPTPVPQSVTRQQMMAMLMMAGLITEAEWLSCYQSGILPAIVANAIATLPTDAAKLVAKVKWIEFSEAKRYDPVVLLLAAHANLTETQVDDLFIQASQL